jgi:hypothetical protein
MALKIHTYSTSTPLLRPDKPTDIEVLRALNKLFPRDSNAESNEIQM